MAHEEDELLYFKSGEISNIKKAYCDKNYRLCYDMCKNSEWSDDELSLIFAECSLNVGIEEFHRGSLRAAVELLDTALESCEMTIYNTDVIRARANSYFSYMRLLSPTLSSNIADEGEHERFIITDDSFCVYSSIICGSQQSGILQLPMLEQRTEILGVESSYALHINARLKIESGDFTTAYELLHKLLFENRYDLPEPMLYFVFCDMELCCKEIEDFRGAYEYSGSKIALLQKLLT